jgi:large subunit ribosomal protein L11
MSKNSKTIAASIKLNVPLGKANPAPPIGPALGQRGLNIMDFCKQFNAIKSNYEVGTPIPVVITAYKDKSFTFITKNPPVSYLIFKEVGIKKGSSTPSREVIGKITSSQVENIIKLKKSDLNALDYKSCAKMIIGTAKSMGLDFQED